MTTITATADNSTGSVGLVITQTSPVTAITRSNANGTSSVRMATGQTPSASTGTTIVTDYEAAHGLNTYNAYVTDIATRTNLATNPRSIGTAYSPNDATTSSTVVTGLGTPTPSGVSSATKGMKVSGTGALIGSWFGMDAQANSATVRSVGAWFRASASGYQAHFSGTGATMAPVVLTTNVWTWVTFAGYSGYLGAYVTRTDGASANLTDFCYLTGVTCLAGTTAPTGHFDGATPDTTDVDYAWTGAANASTSTETTTTRLVTASATLTVDKPWLLVPIAPNYSEQAETITDYSAGRETFSTVHQIIGRADPVVVMGKLGTRTGTLEIWCSDLTEVNRLARVFDRGEAVLLKQAVQGMDMYFSASSIAAAPYSVEGASTRYRFTVQYQEVSRPYGDLAGALGWNFDALAAEYASFDAVTAAFATFDDLTLRDTK